MNRLRSLRLLAALLVLVAMCLRDAPQARAGTSAPLTFTITQVQQVHCDEGFGESCPNDYYPRFNIDLQGLFDGKDTFCCIESRDFQPNWAHTRTVDSSHNPVQIHVELWDQDDASDDDIIDIAPGGARSLDLTFDLNTCTFQGGGLTQQQGAGVPAVLQGQSEGADDDSARIFFTIATPFCIEESYRVDTDGDGLFNAWEVRGLNVDVRGNPLPTLDGPPDLALNKPPFNADPIHKDLFVEVDWMDCAAGGCAPGDTHSHAPVANALNDVVQAFQRAPVSNPNNINGITLHAMQDEAVPDVPNIAFSSPLSGTMDDFDDIKLGNPPGPCKGRFGTAADRASPGCANILAAKRLVFRYAIFGHSFMEAPGSSGRSELDLHDDGTAAGGNDLIVTVGARASFSASLIASLGGQQAVEAGTFMHEFGHALGLQHGGGDPFNCKPNYLSVMNYTFQFPDNDPGRPLDYSSKARGTALGPLNENGALDETKGIGGPAGRLTVYGVGGKFRTAPANAAAIDWNERNGFETAATADINFIDTIKPSSESGGCSTASPSQTLNGYDDWQSIKYNFRDSRDYADGARGPSAEEMTGDQLMAMAARADLKVAKSVDKAVAAGGDTLNYSVPVTNIGRGKATSVTVADTMPDGSTQTRALPDLDKDATNTQAFTFTVPCATADGIVLTNRVSVAATDEHGFPDPDLSDNTAQASTTVHAPVLTLSNVATPWATPGEPIIYAITYKNTGGGAAANVTITDVLPAGVYYSKALDLGLGPKPTTVTLNADGTRTLTWNIGALAAGSGPRTITFTARPTLLAQGGTTYTSNATLSFGNANGCVYTPLDDPASTTIAVLPPTRDPEGLGFWRNHAQLWHADDLASIQATDQRYDTNGDGALSAGEVAATLAPGGNQPKVLQMQVLSTYFNLATRRINASTIINSRTARSLGLNNVRGAALFAADTLRLPVGAANRPRYDQATDLLDEINNGRSEVY